MCKADSFQPYGFRWPLYLALQGIHILAHPIIVHELEVILFMMMMMMMMMMMLIYKKLPNSRHSHSPVINTGRAGSLGDMFLIL